MELNVSDKYDKEFINLILEIEERYSALTKQEKLRIESWVKNYLKIRLKSYAL
jgi:hypothetical protein